MCARKSNAQHNAPTAEKKIRTCVACGNKLVKKQLFRVVRMADNTCVFDATGRVAGRGAYVCSPACLEVAQKQGKLARNLRASIDADSFELIRESMAAAYAEAESEEE